MSMLSAQCDELRELATRYDELQAGAVKAVTMPSNMGPILRDAAHTIWELRCRLVDAEDRVRKSGELCKLCEREEENAKLRQQLADVTESMGRVEERCAKLRELIADVHESLKADKAGMFHNLTLSAMEDDMRELGMEV